MSGKNATGPVLIRENTLLPAGLALQSEAFLPGWRIVRDIDVYGLGRKIEEARWIFFYLAGEEKATVFGRENSGALRGAVKQILAKQGGQKYNLLEIRSIAAKRFLGIPFLSVAANSRHIQESPYLIPGSDVAARIPASRIEPESAKRPYHAEETGELLASV
jgi:hypothetical protein